MSGRVYVDVDDVLSQTTPALCELLEQRTGRRVEVDTLHFFDLGESLSLDPDELREFMDAAHGTEHLAGLAPLEGASDTLRAWSESGLHISILTGRPPHTREATRGWLERHGMRFDRFDCVDKYGRFSGGVRFDEILGDCFAFAIEDNLAIALQLAGRCAERVLLLDRPWNQAPLLPDRLERVADWSEIARSTS